MILCGTWYISFVNYLAATVRLLAELSPLEGVLILAILVLPVLIGKGMAWANGGSTAWQHMNSIFDEDVIFNTLAGQDYKDIYKWRVNLYLVVIQVSALLLLAFVCFGLWIGAFG